MTLWLLFLKHFPSLNECCKVTILRNPKAMHFKISSNEQYYTGNTNNTFSVIFFFFFLWWDLRLFPRSSDSVHFHWQINDLATGIYLQLQNKNFRKGYFSDIAVRRFTSLSVVKCSRLVFSWIAPKIEDSGYQKTLYRRKYTKKKKTDMWNDFSNNLCSVTFQVKIAANMYTVSYHLSLMLKENFFKISYCKE